MWSRAQLKSAAKQTLSQCYWSAFIMVLVITAISGPTLFVGNIALDFNPLYYIDETETGSTLSFFVKIITAVWENQLYIVTITMLVLSVLLTVLLTNPGRVGMSRFFVNASAGKEELGNLFWGFREGRYFNSMKTMLLRDLLCFLWGLLLVIPGVIKSYAYCMVPYILSEQPEIGAGEAMRLSHEMTKGHKWNIFLLDLSFIGWYMLGALACGVGVLFVRPYRESTQFELYQALKG